MFDLTGDEGDKDDLEQNMKEIKQMIDQEDGQKQPQDKSPSGGSPGDNEMPPPIIGQGDQTTEENTQEQVSTGSATQEVDVSPAPERDLNTAPNSQTSSKTKNGPLFIKQSKFDDASRMIGQMRQLSREMQQVTQQLSQGVEEDAQTERRARELLKELDNGRRNVQDVVSPQD
jgi:hypothetical protein